MTDETDPHPIARASLYERMSNIAREAGGNPTPIEAARAHLGTDEPRGSVEDAMIAGADPETGELPPLETETIRAIVEAAPPAQPESSKQEVIEPELAADGRPAPFAARDAGTLINMLENGQLSADVIAALVALTQGMTEIAEATGKRQKGTLTIKINLSTDDTGEAFFVQGEFAVRAPKVERRKTLLWPDEKGHLSPSQPRQRIMFGIKDAGGGPRQIRDATAERRPL